MTSARLCAGIAGLLLTATAADAGSVTFIGKSQDVTDFQAAGLGSDGYWFAQFGAASPTTGAALSDNDRSAFPSWINIGTPELFNESFDGAATSSGGFTAWNSFTLPNGEAGLSGSLVDPGSANNSNNSIDDLLLGVGAPSSFLFSVVIDNTNGAHDPTRRLRARLDPRTSGGTSGDVQLNLTSADFNGTADIYTFRYDGWAAGDAIRLQLNSGQTGRPAGFAGLLFDVVPEPSSATLSLIWLAGYASIGRRGRSMAFRTSAR